MNITRKTFYGIGILSAALNILGGAMLLFSIRADLVFNIATVAAGVMMLMLATNLKEDPRGRNFCLAAALLTVLGMVPGIVGIVCAAASWPVFAWPYFKASVPENGLHKAAFLVMVCGLVLLWAILSPAVRLGGVDAGQWLEDYLAGLELRESELEEQVGNGMKSIIEQETAAYIVDKAAEMGLTCTARVSCQAAEGGVYVPSQTQVAGGLSQAERDRISQMIQADLGVPAQRQFYYEEGLP